MNNLKIHHIQGYIQTMYLVESEGKLLLLDGGCRCDVETIKNYIETILNKSIDDLELVIVTHAHPDHSGGACLFQDKYSIKIAGPEHINEWYAGLSGFLTYWIDILLTHMVAMRKSGKLQNIFFPRKQNLDFILKDLDLVPGFEDWKILSAPGHTAIDLTVYNEKESKAYIADNLVGTGNKIFRPYPMSFPQKYKKTLQRYIDLKIKTFMLAHHGEVEISKERLESLINSTPQLARNHKNTLPKILRHLFRALFKKKR